jgi:hypothetical protein
MDRELPYLFRNHYRSGCGSCVGGEIRGRMNGKNTYTRKVNFVKGVAFDYSVYASYTPGQYYNIQASTIWPFRISCLETNFPTNFVLVSIVRIQECTGLEL